MRVRVRNRVLTLFFSLSLSRQSARDGGVNYGVLCSVREIRAQQTNVKVIACAPYINQSHGLPPEVSVRRRRSVFAVLTNDTGRPENAFGSASLSRANIASQMPRSLNVNDEQRSQNK